MQHFQLYFFHIMLTILSFLTASKGVGVNLLKVGSKRRRTQQEIQDQKEEAKLKQEGMEQKLAQINSLMQRCEELEAKNNDAADLILRDMISKGQVVMDENGNVTIVQFEGSQMQSEQHSEHAGTSLIGQGN